MTSASPDPSGELVRTLLVDRCGYDPGPVGGATRLDDIDGGDLGRLLTVAVVEATYAIAFPADLVSALETVDDLIHFAEVKSSQRDAPSDR